MKSVSVKYSKEQNKKASPCKRIAEIFTSRMPGGRYVVGIKESVRIDRKLKTKESRAVVRHFILNYLFGNTITDRVFKKEKEVCDRFFIDLHSFKVEYTPRDYLYHYVPCESVGRIAEQGLVATRSGKERDGLVFMTYAPQLLTRYLHWKTDELGRDVDFALLRIDAKRLSDARKLYYYREFEVVTDHVEPEYIEFE